MEKRLLGALGEATVAVDCIKAHLYPTFLPFDSFAICIVPTLIPTQSPNKPLFFFFAGVQSNWDPNISPIHPKLKSVKLVWLPRLENLPFIQKAQIKMGAFCCCCPGGGDELEEYPSGCVNSICTHRICLRFFFHHFFSGGAAFTSSGMGTLIPDSSQNEAHYFSRPLPFDAAQRYSRLQRDGLVSRREKSVTHFQEDMLPLRRNMSSSSVELLGSGKKWDGDTTEDSKLGHSESSVKEQPIEVSQGVLYIGPSSEEDDLCPTCLEEYTEENPKIRTKCSHHFHLGCIYEWMERSDSCPICGKEMEFCESP